MRALALLFVLLSQVDQAPQELPADFAFRFEFGCADRDTIDTFEGIYSRDNAQSTRIEVTPELKRELFAAVQDAGFFEMPTSVSGPLCEPTILSALEVRANGVTHRTSWDHCAEGMLTDPNVRIDPRKADLLGRLYRLGPAISRPFQTQKGVQRLRSANYVCL